MLAEKLGFIWNIFGFFNRPQLRWILTIFYHGSNFSSLDASLGKRQLRIASKSEVTSNSVVSVA